MNLKAPQLLFVGILSFSAPAFSLTRPQVSRPTEGTMTDSRDGNTYRTVTIGSQTWMSENLNTLSPGSLCCDSLDRLGCVASASQCDRTGRSYTREDALEICPDGWRLPSVDDWRVLLNLGKNTPAPFLSATGWKNVKATNSLGFDVKPGGIAIRPTNAVVPTLLQTGAEFWTSSQTGPNDSTGAVLAVNFTSEAVTIADLPKRATLRKQLGSPESLPGQPYLNVRCIQATVPEAVVNK